MTHYVFHDVLHKFHDPEDEKPFDEANGRNQAIEQIKESLRAHWDVEGATANDGTLKTPEPLCRHATALVGFLEDGLINLLTRLIPSNEATANTDFVLETSAGIPVKADAKLNALKEGKPKKTPDHVLRIANLTLEQNFQALLDHLTAKRIAEELDTPTYLGRMRSSFKRVHDGSLSQAKKLEARSHWAQRAISGVTLILELATFLKVEVLSKLAASDATPEGKKCAERVDRLLRFAQNSKGYLVHLSAFVAASSNGLQQVHQDFCANSNVAAAEGESRLVSAEIERRPIYRPLPLIWVLCVTLLVKIVLAQNTSESLHYLSVSILIFSFIATWVLLIPIGVWARNRRMKGVQLHTRRPLKHHQSAQIYQQ